MFNYPERPLAGLRQGAPASQLPMRFVSYTGFTSFGLKSLYNKLSLAALWVWNSTNGKPCYYDMRADKHVFWGFSWIVWAGFMARFGGTLWLKVGAFYTKLETLASALLQLLAGLLPNNPSPLGANLTAPLANAFTASGFSWGLNPEKDLDLTVNTDCEDLAAFANDVFEFIEQDRSLLLDSLTDFGAAAAFAVGALGAHRVLSSRLFKRRK